MKRFGLAALLTLAVALPIAAEPRDWKEHPAIVERQMPADLYALGDVHGDYERMAELLAGARLIAAVPRSPEQVVWSGGAAVLICTGDFINKYDHAASAIGMFRALQPQAARAGGQFIVTLGNHEADFIASGGGKKKAAEFATELKAIGLLPADIAAGKDALGIGAWMRDLPAGAKVGEWFFCHAGNTGGRTLNQLRMELGAAIAADGFGASILSNPNSMLQARLHPRQWWDAAAEIQLKDSGKGEPQPPAAGAQSEKRLRAVVEALGCHHLVCGHQPGKITFADGSVREAGQVCMKFNGLLYLIDTGMSRGQNSGRGALLKLHEGDASVVYADGKETAINAKDK